MAIMVKLIEMLFCIGLFMYLNLDLTIVLISFTLNELNSVYSNGCWLLRETEILGAVLPFYESFLVIAFQDDGNLPQMWILWRYILWSYHFDLSLYVVTGSDCSVNLSTNVWWLIVIVLRILKLKEYVWELIEFSFPVHISVIASMFKKCLGSWVLVVSFVPLLVHHGFAYILCLWSLEVIFPLVSLEVPEFFWFGYDVVRLGLYPLLSMILWPFKFVLWLSVRHNHSQQYSISYKFGSWREG